MIKEFLIPTLILSMTGMAVASDMSLTQGRDYDVAVIDSTSDAGVAVTARVRTNAARVNSASSITVTDNGRVIYGPAQREDSAWAETVAVLGKGPHTIRVDCGHANSTPVFCRLEADQPKAER